LAQEGLSKGETICDASWRQGCDREIAGNGGGSGANGRGARISGLLDIWSPKAPKICEGGSPVSPVFVQFVGTSGTHGRDHPPLKQVRCSSKTATAVCSFVDASGRGVGSTFQVGNQIFFQHGQWPKQVNETTSSDWRKLADLVECLEVEVREQGLSNFEIFPLTDNTTAEAAQWKGKSKSGKLFGLILRLRLLEMNSDLIIHVIHVARTWMMAQGTDRILQGDKSMGAMRGIPMERFCPMHQSAFEQSPELKSWLTAATNKSVDPLVS
jgi:hypothetical protein